ncbi:MAG: DUF924 family protein [Pseudomonadota bacterium]
MISAATVLEFWFEEAGPRRWFKRSADFDSLCRDRFLEATAAAARGECWSWRRTPRGRCAEILLLDQLPRNLFRGTARAFAQDGMALVLAQEAVASGDDLRLSDDERYFGYMPYMHSESLLVHDEGITLFEKLGNPKALQYAVAHREVIQRFGRYPVRNAALGRQSSEDELDYIAKNSVF